MNLIYYLIAFLLAVDNVFINFRFFGMSYDRWLEFALFLVLLKPYLIALRTNPFIRKLSLFILIFAVLQLLVNLNLAISGEFEFTVVYTELIKCISYLVFAFLFYQIAIQGPKYINVLLAFHFCICVFSLLGHPLSPVASQILEIKSILYSSVQEGNAVEKLGTEAEYVEGGFANRFRLSGPFASSISFSYYAVTSFALTFFMFIRYRKRYYLVMLGLLFLASLFSQTRSLLLAEIVLVGGYFFFAPARQHFINKALLVLGGLAAITFIYAGRDILLPENSRITQISSEGGEDTRPYLWLTGIVTIAEHPFGVKAKNYQQVRNDMAALTGKTYVVYLAPHNGLINIGFQYSIFGYLVFLAFIIFLWRYISLLPPKSKLFFRLILLSYLIHCSFHNNFIFINDYNILLLVSLIGVELKNNRIASNQKGIPSPSLQ